MKEYQHLIGKIIVAVAIIVAAIIIAQVQRLQKGNKIEFFRDCFPKYTKTPSAKQTAQSVEKVKQKCLAFSLI